MPNAGVFRFIALLPSLSSICRCIISRILPQGAAQPQRTLHLIPTSDASAAQPEPAIPCYVACPYQEQRSQSNAIPTSERQRSPIHDIPTQSHPETNDDDLSSPVLTPDGKRIAMRLLKSFIDNSTVDMQRRYQRLYASKEGHFEEEGRSGAQRMNMLSCIDGNMCFTMRPFPITVCVESIILQYSFSHHHTWVCL